MSLSLDVIRHVLEFESTVGTWSGPRVMLVSRGARRAAVWAATHSASGRRWVARALLHRCRRPLPAWITDEVARVALATERCSYEDPETLCAALWTNLPSVLEHALQPRLDGPSPAVTASLLAEHASEDALRVVLARCEPSTLLRFACAVLCASDPVGPNRRVIQSSAAERLPEQQLRSLACLLVCDRDKLPRSSSAALDKEVLTEVLAQMKHENVPNHESTAVALVWHLREHPSDATAHQCLAHGLRRGVCEPSCSDDAACPHFAAAAQRELLRVAQGRGSRPALSRALLTASVTALGEDEDLLDAIWADVVASRMDWLEVVGLAASETAARRLMRRLEESRVQPTPMWAPRVYARLNFPAYKAVYRAQEAQLARLSTSHLAATYLQANFVHHVRCWGSLGLRDRFAEMARDFPDTWRAEYVYMGDTGNLLDDNPLGSLMFDFGIDPRILTQALARGARVNLPSVLPHTLAAHGVPPKGTPLHALADDLLRREGFLDARGMETVVRDADRETIEWVLDRVAATSSLPTDVRVAAHQAALARKDAAGVGALARRGLWTPSPCCLDVCCVDGSVVNYIVDHGL